MAVRAPRNRTLCLSPCDKERLRPRLHRLQQSATLPEILDKTFCQDLLKLLPHLPDQWVDLLIIDPPYNLAKTFHGSAFRRQTVPEYTAWLRTWFMPLLRLLKPTASVYVCGDWLTSVSLFEVLHSSLLVRNRITWEREKGRGAKANWKNCSEDIWFATCGEEYCFNAEAVRLKRRVRAPYTVAGQPKDWTREPEGNYRLTSPSNLWSDITVPFWSMPENTPHPTQKPEKLIAKLILASSRPNEVVFDPFLGSGTTSVVAKKLGRHFVGVEQNRDYCLLTERRLELAEAQKTIQGMSGGCFWERNSQPAPV